MQHFGNLDSNAQRFKDTTQGKIGIFRLQYPTLQVISKLKGLERQKIVSFLIRSSYTKIFREEF